MNNDQITLEGDYLMMTNDKDELMLVIAEKEKEPQEAKMLYDGGNHAILYRDQNDPVYLDYINPDVRSKLAKAENIVVVEVLPLGENLAETDKINLDPVRDYDASVKHVKHLPLEALYKLPEI